MPYMQAPKMRRPTLHAILAGCALLAFTAGSPTASAQTVPREAETTRAFDITAKPLANAIMQFTEQSGIPVAYPAALGAGKRSAAVKGRFHPLEALSRLLVETGLAARMTPAGVTLEARATAAANAAEPAQIGSVTVTSTALERSATTGNTRSYSTDQVSIDRLSSSLRDIPQAVTVITREQLDALNLNSVNDAIALQSGAIVIQNDGTNERAEIMFRGFLADSLRVDGGAVSGNNDVTTFDAAIFDRIEILRGPAGILQGAGDPGGTINLVRNRATDTRSVNAEAQVGSWDQLRGVVDIGGPITAQGGVRARAIALINKSDSFVDLTNSRRFTLFGTVDLDVTPDTTVTVGGTWQEAEGRNGRGLPGYADGTIPDVARSTFIGARWNHNKTRSADIFANLEHRLPGGAVFRLTTSYLDRSRHGKLAFPDSAVDPATGETLLENEYRIDTEENLNLDANLRVPFDLGGLEHALLIGADYRRINEARRAAAGGYVAQNVFSPDHDIAEPDWIFEEFLATRTEQLGTYAQARIKPVSWATFMTGGRMTWWKARAYEGVADELVGVTKVDGKFTPYAAALADLNGFLTAYASYTSIFVPQDDVTIENEAVAPRVGRQFEIGVKGSALDDALNGYVAIFDIQDRNRAIADQSNEDYAVAAGKVRSRGFETEVTGEVLPGLQIIAGYSYVGARYLEDAEFDGMRFDPRVPKHTGRLWGNFRFPAGALAGLGLGGGVRAYSSTYERDDDVHYRQGSFAIVDAQASYRLDDRFEFTATISNLFDRNYYSVMGYSERQTYFGTPRAVTFKAKAAL